MTENEIGTVVVDDAIEVHRHLGPGLLESVYGNASDAAEAKRLGDKLGRMVFGD